MASWSLRITDHLDVLVSYNTKFSNSVFNSGRTFVISRITANFLIIYGLYKDREREMEERD